MVICQVINSLSSGGAEVFTSQLAVSLQKKGHNVILITYQGCIDKKGEILNDYLRNSGVEVIHMSGFRKGAIGYLKVFFFLLITLHKIKPNVVHAHLQMSDFFVGIAAKTFIIKKPKLIRTIHNKRRAARLNHFFESLLFKSFDFNIACSDFVKNNYENPKLRKYISSIPNGIDLSELNSYVNIDKDSLKEELDLPPNKKIIFNIGSMYLSDNAISKKNQQFIIEAVEKLRDRDDFIVVFLGDGPLRNDFEDSVKKKRINDKIIFKGNVLNVYKFIFAGDICVMPSKDEGLPIALIETVCAGKHAIVSPIDAFTPFKSNSVKNLKSFELNEFVDEIVDSLDNIGKYNRLAKENTVYYKSTFDISVVAQKYLNYY